jgi:hypothetical protein
MSCFGLAVDFILNLKFSNYQIRLHITAISRQLRSHIGTFKIESEGIVVLICRRHIWGGQEQVTDEKLLKIVLF